MWNVNKSPVSLRDPAYLPKHSLHVPTAVVGDLMQHDGVLVLRRPVIPQEAPGLRGPQRKTLRAEKRLCEYNQRLKKDFSWAVKMRTCRAGGGECGAPGKGSWEETAPRPAKEGHLKPEQEEGRVKRTPEGVPASPCRRAKRTNQTASPQVTTEA